MHKQIWNPSCMLGPIPAVMVSCQYPEPHDPMCEIPALDGKPNIITIAWVGTICSNPAMLSISVKPERYSYHILEASGEFVVNLTTEKLLAATDFCGVRSGKDMDKFSKCGLTPLAMEHVAAPGIAESPVNIECQITQEIPLGSHTMFLAKVLGVAVDESLINKDGKFCLEDANLVAYSHGVYHALGKQLGTFGYSVKKTVGSQRKKN